MAINSIANSLNSKLRMSGMASGLDTDALIKKIMTAETMKMDKLKQQRELSVWKTDAYRDVTSTLKSFYSDYLDTVSPKNIKSANAFSSFSSTFVDTTKSDYIGVNPGAGATPGTYKITDITVAEVASITGNTDMSKIVSTGVISDADVQKISSADFSNQFLFTFNNKTVQLSLKDGMQNVGELTSELQSQLNTQYGAGKITVTNNAGKLEFTGKSTDVFSIGTVNNLGAGTLFNVAPTVAQPFTLNAGNDKFEFTIDGVKKVITVPPVDAAGNTTNVFNNATDLAAAIQKGVESQFGTSTGVTFENKDGKVVVKTTAKQVTSVGYAKNEMTNTLLNVDYSRVSNKVDIYSTLDKIIPGLNTSNTITGVIGGDPDHDIEFTINGKSFKFNSKNDSLYNVMTKVNSDTSINVSMKFDISTNGFKISSRNTGVTAKVDIADASGTGLMTALGLVDTKYGKDAILKIDGIAEDIVRPTNSFTYNGIAFDLKKNLSSATDAPIVVNVASDTTKTFDFIKEFVNKYNDLIKNLNSKISEKKYRDYLPLTDEQKAAMSDDQIKKWETYAKSGLLKDDSIISGTLSKFRSALYASVEGVGVNLSSIGITTSSDYLEKGKLVIDETKLKDALVNKPEEVMNLFIKDSDTSYYNAINGSSADISKRNKEAGLAQRLSDTIQDAIRTSMDKNGQKGLLLEKAGMVGDRTEFTSLLYKEIDSFDKAVVDMNHKLTEKENSLYKKFSALETAMNKMNSQSSWIAQQFGGGKQ